MPTFPLEVLSIHFLSRPPYSVLSKFSHIKTPPRADILCLWVLAPRPLFLFSFASFTRRVGKNHRNLLEPNGRKYT